MDTIFINGLIFSGRHGVYEEEWQRSQRFGVAVEVQIEERDRNEDLNLTFDYMHARDVVKEIIEGPSCKLIETLAERIARRVLASPIVRQVSVCVRKLDIVQPAEVGVKIVRSR